eukprot:6954569-Karenia_brevis.AAC.1
MKMKMKMKKKMTTTVTMIGSKTMTMTMTKDTVGVPFRSLTPRWAIFAGDGALVPGGPDAKQNGGALPLLWQRIGRKE